MEINQKLRLGFNQRRGWRIIKTEKFINQKKEEEKLKRELVAGSNEEKISTIIKVRNTNEYWLETLED